MQKYILGLLGAENNNDKQIQEKWQEIRKDYQQRLDVAIGEVEKRFKLSRWAAIALGIPMGIPLLIYNLKKGNEKKRITQEETDKFFDGYCKDLNQVHTALIRLKDLEKIVQKKEEIAEMFNAMPLSFSSGEDIEASAQMRIDRVREIYGAEDWDNRVAFLAEKLGSFLIKLKKDFPDHSTQYYVSLIFFGQDPAIDIVQFNSIVQAKASLRAQGIDVQSNALLFKRKDSNQITFLKRHKDGEKRFDLAKYSQEQSPIEVINMQRSFLVSKQKKLNFLERFMSFASNIGMDTGTPFSQTLFAAATSMKLGKSFSVTKDLMELPMVSLKCFGKLAWEEYFGDIGVEPPLPANIEEILSFSCPFWPNKKVHETHLLVLIPETVNGKPFHLDSLSELIQLPKTGHKTRYRCYDSDVKKELGTKSRPSHWILITRDVIPGSRGISYDDQKALVQKYAQSSGIPYELPTILEVVTAILIHYAEIGKRLFLFKYLYSMSRNGG